MSAIEKGGSEAWGQIAATPAAVQDDRPGGSGPGRPARARGPAREGRVAPFVEGDVAKEVAKKLGPGVTVEGVSP